MTRLTKDGETFLGQENIAAMVDGYYDNLLGTPTQRAHTLNLDALDLPSLDLSHLELPFTAEEVERTVKSMPLDKAPGPDGFTGRLYASCWGIIKEDVMDAFRAFGRLDFQGLTSMNQAFVTLLPKSPAALEVRDFRTISLIHSFPKLVAKVMSLRVAPEMTNIVGTHQSAFIQGRCLHDNYMLVQGTVRWLQSTKRPALMLKLDITKAFDTADWAFLLEVLRHLGFGDKWIAWVAGLLASSSTRVLLNGVPGKVIYNKCGFRQGDPLPPSSSSWS